MIEKIDAVDLCKRQEDESIGCIITDPPYSVSKKGSKITRKNKADIKLDYGKWDRFTYNQYYRFTRSWLKEAIRSLKKEGWVAIFFDAGKLDILLRLIKKFGVIYRSLYIWCKNNPAPSYRKYNWVSSVEYCFIGSKGKSRIPNFLTQKEMKNWMVTSHSGSFGVTEHPHEKPLKLIKLFVSTLGDKDKPILDPFVGSGTTAIACEELGYDYVCGDNNEEYISMAKKRVKKIQNKLKLRQGDVLGV